MSFAQDCLDLNAGFKWKSIGTGAYKIRNPTWSRDELILALELYFQRREKLICNVSASCRELSNLLRQLHIHNAHPNATKFRNETGVYMKRKNFSRFDPEYAGNGLVNGGKLESEVWQEFCADRDRLKSTSEAIQAFAVTGSEIDARLDEELFGVSEGSLLLNVHIRRERNPQLVKHKKKLAMRGTGRLSCEVCNFDFAAVYGNIGTGYAECHHNKPLCSLRPGQITHLNDLSLVCLNCHRMLHRHRPLMLLPELRGLLSSRV